MTRNRINHQTDLFIKRILDIFFSLVGIVVLLPLFFMVALAIKLDDGGDVFYHQIRCTIDLKEFSIHKFRSLKSSTADEYEIGLVKENDERITSVGKFLRRWKIDELPQLFNILAGEMSFVGPRPERPEIIKEALKDIPGFSKRNTMKGGLTGLAQIKGGYNAPLKEKLKWDMIYIGNFSVLYDIKIILLTIPHVLFHAQP